MDGITTNAIQNWEWAASLLPLLIGAVIRSGMTRSMQAKVAVAVYVVYGLIGAYLNGEFTGLTWTTPEEVMTSILAVAMIGFAAYKTIFQAFPLPQFIEEKTGGDPMIAVVPQQNPV